MAEHGIAPKSLKIKQDYRDESSTGMAHQGGAPRQMPRKDLGPAASLLFSVDDMIRPTRNTIGARMLRKIGWREGQGIGPKIKRKLRRMKAKQTFGIHTFAALFETF